jgi:uncharacterized protein YjbI with pentapeptide repeats
VQVSKPQALGLSTRPIEYRKRFGLCVTASLHVPFAQGECGALWGEQSMWNFLTKEMGAPFIDEGVSKLTSEYLVHGHAYPPADGSTACAVRVQLAGQEKTILAFGDRYWNGGKVSAPATFDKMPLSWSAAYGGADFEKNAVGKGRAEVQGIRPLPNLELPQSRIIRPDQEVQPAGFGLLDVMHPQRVQYRGTYDASYLKEHSPGFAPDMDWRYFNLASADQWLRQPLRGDEAFSLDHLHPTQPHIKGHLPGLRTRVFADYKLADGDFKMREVPMRLTTVWFFPHAERCILLFHGLAEVDTDDGSDIVSLLGAVERLGEVKPDEHYVKVLEMRAEPKMGPIHSLRDSDLMPEGINAVDPDFEEAKKAFAMDGLQGDAQYRGAELQVELARDQARAQGKDPDAMGIKMPPREKPPTGDELAPYMEKKMKEAEFAQWQALDDALTHVMKAMAFAEEHKIDMAQLQHRGPPVYSAATHIQELKDGGQLGANDPQELYGKLQQKEGAERMNYLQAAHQQAKAPAMPAAEAAALRGELVIASLNGLRLFPGLDFTGADFSGLDLRGFNFAGAWLESVNFNKANLSGADFSYAVLAYADLSESIAVGTKFTGANLGRSKLRNCVFDDTDLSGATLMFCNFDKTQFRRSKLNGAMLLDTQWGKADWSGAQLAGQTFYKLDLQGMVLTEANLAGCNFIECDLTGVDLRGANLMGATFATSKLDKAQLQFAKAKGAIFAKECTLTNADLSQADLSGCNFGAADMTGVRLMKALLDSANLSDAKIDQSDWHLASAKSALLCKTKLKDALLVGVNFQDAILQNADLLGADLTNSNLFSADMSRVRLNGDVKFDGALLKRARTWPRLTPEQQAAVV